MELLMLSLKTFCAFDRPEIQSHALTRTKGRAPHKRFTDEHGRLRPRRLADTRLPPPTARISWTD